MKLRSERMVTNQVTEGRRWTSLEFTARAPCWAGSTWETIHFINSSCQKRHLAKFALNDAAGLLFTR